MPAASVAMTVALAAVSRAPSASTSQQLVARAWTLRRTASSSGSSPRSLRDAPGETMSVAAALPPRARKRYDLRTAAVERGARSVATFSERNRPSSRRRRVAPARLRVRPRAARDHAALPGGRNFRARRAPAPFSRTIPLLRGITVASGPHPQARTVAGHGGQCRRQAAGPVASACGKVQTGPCAQQDCKKDNPRRPRTQRTVAGSKAWRAGDGERAARRERRS